MVGTESNKQTPIGQVEVTTTAWSLTRDKHGPYMERRLEGWLVVCRLAFKGTQIVTTGLHVTRPPDAQRPPAAITTGFLRKVGIATGVQWVSTFSREVAAELNHPIFEAGDIFGGLARPIARGQRSRRGRPRLDDRYLAELARDYARFAKRSEAPHRELMALHRLPTLATSKLRIREARARGLLTPGTRGLAGGKLTPRALRLLRAKKRRVAKR
jgi:hypothetical protein